MDILSIEKVNYGDHYVERGYCDNIKNLDGGKIIMSQDYLKIENDANCLETKIVFYEKDPFTDSWVGNFSDGTQFRIVKPNPLFVKFTGNTITIASMYHDGFAVHFNIV